MKKLALVAAVSLVAAAAAQAGGSGGWATVQLSSMPTGMKAGQAWVVDVTVLQHGRTPIDGCTPAITISNGKMTKRFPARKLAKVGLYRFRVVFPDAGVWRFAVYDGFTRYGGARTHRYAPVRIAA